MTPPAPAQPTPSTIHGIWLGTLYAESKNLRLQLRIDSTTTPPSCSLDSLDQHAVGIPCQNVTVNGSSVSVDVPAVKGTLAGTLSDDGRMVSAIWTQG